MKKKLSKAEQGEQTKQAILLAAQKLFFTQDYNSISTAQIAKEASKIAKENKFYRSSISKASIFHHFVSKERLALALFDVIMQGMLAAFGEYDESMDAQTYLETIITNSIEFTVNSPGMMQFLLQVTDELSKSGDRSLWERVGKMFEDFVEMFSNIFNEMGIANAEIRARMLFAALDGLGLHLYIYHEAGTKVNVEELIKEFMSLIKTWVNQGEQL